MGAHLLQQANNEKGGRMKERKIEVVGVDVYLKCVEVLREDEEVHDVSRGGAGHSSGEGLDALPTAQQSTKCQLEF
jgi:hypothetical protein